MSAKNVDKIVEIVEVSPRDGIQNEKRMLSTAQKLELIARAVASGAQQVEVTSFVNPKAVPQMADAMALLAALPREGARYSALALNARGFDQAVEAALDEVNFVVVTSDSFSLRNQRMTSHEAAAVWGQMGARVAGQITTNLTLGAFFGCPFEGEVPMARALDVLDRCLQAAHPDIVTLADTIGVATPWDIEARIGAVQARFPDLRLRLHLHNTRNTGIANAWAGYKMGVRSFDAALGGAGGCPFAPKATGNVASEDLVYMFERAGITTGYDLTRSIETGLWLEEQLGHPLAGMVKAAGRFPKGSAA